MSACPHAITKNRQKQLESFSPVNMRLQFW
jgi:hypothetical protein